MLPSTTCEINGMFFFKTSAYKLRTKKPSENKVWGVYFLKRSKMHHTKNAQGHYKNALGMEVKGRGEVKAINRSGGKGGRIKKKKDGDNKLR